MRILFITSTRIGDAVLSTGLLRCINETYPDAEVTIACGALPSSLFEGYPNLKKIIILEKQKYNKHWFKLWKKVIPIKWDIVIDFRNSIVSRTVFSSTKYVYGPQIDSNLHKVEQAAQLMGLENAPAPKLWFTAEQMIIAKAFIPGDEKVLAVGPTANWVGKTWPAENFIRTIKWLTGIGGFLEGAKVAVFAAPGEEEGAYKVLQSIPEEKQIDVIAKTDPGTAAAIISLCNFFIGNDSGLMHSAAAAGVSTLGVFGPSYPHLYAPWGPHTCHVQTPQSFDELTDYDGYSPQTLTKTLMGGLTVEAAKKAITDNKVRLFD
ncbi:MAG: glycosyltransferase 9 family protein [Alphaproteobacteria bacterium]|nr:glycosyltransferase 9 family protein [Alphaproteobacteria bacterium]